MPNQMVGCQKVPGSSRCWRSVNKGKCPALVADRDIRSKGRCIAGSTHHEEVTMLLKKCRRIPGSSRCYKNIDQGKCPAFMSGGEKRPEGQCVGSSHLAN